MKALKALLLLSVVLFLFACEVVPEITPPVVPKVIVIFNADGGNPAPSPITIVKGSTMGDLFPVQPEKEGFTFAGWFDGDVQYTKDTTVDSDLFLKAKWAKSGGGEPEPGEPEEVTITFVTNASGGESPAPSAITINKGSSMGAKYPADPTKPDYLFAGWQEEGIPYTKDTPVNDNITLTAHWTREQITITFNTDGGSAPPAPVTIAKGYSMGASFPAANPPTKAGFVFNGWFNGATQYTSTTTIDNDITLIAKWDITVTFNAAGGSPTPAVVTIAAGASMGSKFPADPARAGYRFDGWWLSGTKYISTTAISASITLEAKWVAQVTVTFNSDGGNSTPAAITIDQGSSLGSQLPASPGKTNYVFKGWFNGATEYTGSTVINSSVTLKAEWELGALPKVTVTFNTDGGSAAPASIQVDQGTSIGSSFPANPTKANNRFVGWFNGATQYTSTTAINSNITLTARWAATVTVTFDTKGGNSISPVTIDQGTTLGSQFPSSPTRPGYIFEDWFVGAIQYSSSSTISANVTITARWGVTVTFDGAGGSPVPSSIQVTEGTSMGAKYPASNPSKTGYTFDGWFNGGTKYIATTVINSSVNLTAQWTVEKVTVTFNTDGGSANPASIQVDKGSSIGSSFPANPTKANNRFVGWFVGAAQYTSASAINDSITLTARWVAQATVTFNTNGGSTAPAPVTIDQGTTLAAQFPANPTRTNFIFEGWFVGTGTAQYTSGTVINANTTLTARWAVTVTFNSDGGTPVSSIQVTEGTSMGSKYPADPTKANFAFAGWFNGATQYTSSTTISANITLTAQWTAVGTPVTGTWKGLAIPAATTASQYSTFQGKAEVLKASPNEGNNFAVLSYGLNDYAGKEITITLSMSVWLDAATKVAWQTNTTGYPLVAGSYTAIAAGQWHTITGSEKVTVPSAGATLYLSTEQLGSNAVHITGFTISIVEEAAPPPATLADTWKLTVPAATTAEELSTYQGKSTVLHISPSGASYNWAPLEYSLENYVGKEVYISVSMEVRLTTAAKIAWQLNSSSYPLVAGNTGTALTVNTWHTIQGSITITVETGNMLYLSGDASYGIASGDVYITGFTVTVSETGTNDPADMLNLPAMKTQFASKFKIGNIATTTDANSGGTAITNQRLLRHYNVLTSENDMKPDSYAGSRSGNTVNGLNFAKADRFVNAARGSGFDILAHVLLWHNQTPQWQKDMANIGNTTTARAVLEDYVTKVVTQYKGKIWAWDVLNEVFPDGIAASANWRTSMRGSGAASDNQGANPWYMAFGGTSNSGSGADFVYYAYRAARLADPLAKLYYNDYNMDSVGKATMVRDMVQAVNNQWASSSDYDGRKLIEGIGMQSHHNTNVTSAQIQATLTLFRPLGVKISISELDILSGPYSTNLDTGPNMPQHSSVTDANKTAAATRYYEYFKLFLQNTDIIERVTFWGINDEQSWRSAGKPLPFEGGNPSMAKPAYYRIIDALEGR